MSRRAPHGGYDRPPKRDQRRCIHAVFRREIKRLRQPLADAHILLMPSTEGDEIEVALGRGYRQHNLHVCDQNPAIVATLKRRYPYISTYGCKVDRAAWRIAQKGIRLTAANLDLTANATSPDVLDQLPRFMMTGAMADRSVISITIKRGREKAFHSVQGIGAKVLSLRFDMAWGTDNLYAADHGRLAILHSVLSAAGTDMEPFYKSVGTEPYVATLVRFGRYQSYRSPMLWATFTLENANGIKTRIATGAPADVRQEVGRILTSLEQFVACM